MPASMSTTTASPALIQDFFARIAASYEKGTGGCTRIIARHLINLVSPVSAGANILDNACGTGIVIEELLAKISTNGIDTDISITATDASKPMIDIVTDKASTTWKLPAQSKLQTFVLSAEKLDDLPSNIFDISFTNFGFQFFGNPEEAASHVYRTLRPGGKAFVTAWHDIGYWNGVEEAALIVRPGLPIPKLPYDSAWSEAQHLTSIMSRAGFAEVQVHQKESSFTAASTEEMAQVLVDGLKPKLKMDGWTDEEIAKFPQDLRKAIDAYTDGPSVDASGTHLKMIANIAVCTK